jgi:hypothetical protein
MISLVLLLVLRDRSGLQHPVIDMLPFCLRLFLLTTPTADLHLSKHLDALRQYPDSRLMQSTHPARYVPNASRATKAGCFQPSLHVST